MNGPSEYGFRVFLDATNPNPTDHFVRWRFSGVYKFLTYPERHLLHSACMTPPDPLPCSGAVFSGGILTYKEPCTCCFCWVSEFEDKPVLSESEIISDGTFKKVEMGFVPVNSITFSQRRYMVRVEQMSLSSQAFEYWKIIQDQKEGLTSLFQPAFGKIRTNFFSNNSNATAIGIFSASAISKKILFLDEADVPITLPQPVVPPEEACTYWNACDKIFTSASRIPPPEWQ